ncbi:penicillin-binding protein 1C [Oleisolibacter albus]|uniref:penicillin-binding protein 1C n=1 Tax=Oleisolibacter albus TaxID=2171757 RepID=UPI000DF21849|nr:penicillin-binding protein 1C [Oleisolibacter albus]
MTVPPSPARPPDGPPSRQPPEPDRRRALLRALRSGVLGCGLVCGGVLLADRLFPPDLGRYQARSTLVLDRDGGTLRGFLSPDGAWRLEAGVEDVAPLYLDLLRGYEDRRFDRHPGIDPLALLRAVGQAWRHGRVISGGSTLTMQVARLLEPRPRTLSAKLIEMLRALQLEAHYSKAEILGFYLTLAPFGGNLEGVRAASLAYFGREPAQLTPAQAALLVALPQSPTARRPDLHPEAARRARTQVLQRLHAAGRLDARTLAEADAEPLPLARQPLPRIAPHLAERLAGASPPGSTLRTTIDPALQRLAEQVAATARQRLEPEAEVAALVLEIRSRAVLAYVGGSVSGPAGQVDMVRALRSPGSTLKPLLYALAFEGLPLHPETRIEDRPIAFGAYRPGNFGGGFRGSLTVRSALQQSLNVPAVGLLARLGPAQVAGRLRAAGMQLALPGGPGAEAGLSLALGGVGVRLEHLAGAYAALADGGVARPLRLLADSPVATGTRLVDPRAAWSVVDILRGTPPPDGRSPDPDRPLAYKTGTSYGFRDAWAAGFTPDHVLVVWVGRPDGTPRPGAVGRDEAAPILFRLADLLPRGRGFPPPPMGVLPTGAPLPEPLRHFELDPLRAVVATPPAAAPLAVAFPPDGAEVDLAAGSGQPEALPLEAMGGRPPFRWLVNDLPLPGGEEGEGARFWQPDGPGFARITVIDSAGQQARSTVRLR